MIIRLNENRMIRSDKYQFMLCKRGEHKNKETGNLDEVWTPYLFYTDIRQLLKAVPQQMLKESDAEGWEACKEVLERTYQMLVLRIM